MSVVRPYRRTVRQFTDGRYAEGGRWMYVLHPKFATTPEHYIRAFYLIQKDLLEIFDYVEPSDTNLQCYSYRIHELFIRTCIEVEANFKGILSDNGYARPGNWTIQDYKKIESSHFLSQYRVKLPVWRGASRVFTPFNHWNADRPLAWYQNYNAAKHDRHNDFSKANLESLLNAITGLVVLLSASFWTEDFSPHAGAILISQTNDGFDTAIGEYFRVQFPQNWPDAQRYEFEWRALENEENPFVNFPYAF